MFASFTQLSWGKKEPDHTLLKTPQRLNSQNTVKSLGNHYFYSEATVTVEANLTSYFNWILPTRSIAHQLLCQKQLTWLLAKDSTYC